MPPSRLLQQNNRYEFACETVLVGSLFFPFSDRGARVNFSGSKVYFVGIKGTGMASLAILLKASGALVSGCDVEETFITDELLQAHSIVVHEGFSPSLLSPDADMVIHSTAYQPTMPILLEATRLGLAIYSYPQFLSYLSTLGDSYAVAGTHGKTTTVAIVSYLLSTGTFTSFPFYSIFGSAVQGLALPFYQGSDSALFEACEYQDHFLSYHLRGALVTNIEHDHPDYFSTEREVQKSFESFVDNLASGGFLICCSDDKGAKSLASYARRVRADLTVMTYGFDDNGPFRIIKRSYEDAYSLSCLDTFSFSLPVHERFLIGNYVGSVVLAIAMILDRENPKLYLESGTLITAEIIPTLAGMLSKKLSLFPGVVGRCEIMKEEDGVLYLDDYAHHPTEIITVLGELHARYPNRPILVVFAPHTASRTRTFLKDFVLALSMADRLVLQSCYGSARNDNALDEGQDMGEVLAHALGERIMRTTRCRLQGCIYAHDDEEAVAIASGWLQPQDLCITMGAGNNRALTERIAQARRSL
jgi:UDP-N-acetylmuramate--alanine ligase